MGTWNVGMYLLFKPLTCQQGESQYEPIQCKWTKTHEIIIMFNEKPNSIQISKIITHDIMIAWQNFILLSQQVQNMSLLTIHTNYTKFAMHQLKTIYGCFW